MKQVFKRVGNLVVNQYEVREVRLCNPRYCYPKVQITYKDGTKATASGSNVPSFVKWLENAWSGDEY